MNLKHLEPSLQKEMAAFQSNLSTIDQELARRDFNDYCRMMLEVEPARHHLFLNDKLMAVERGEIKRLMIFMPPGYAKSTYASVAFPAWIIGRDPKRSIICASHAKDLAEGFSRKVRGHVKSNEYHGIFDLELSRESQSVSRWQVEYDDNGNKKKGAEYYAVGIDSSITGKRANGAIIDDPVKGIKEARSPVVQKSTLEWYKTDLRTRLLPEAFQIIIQTRWDVNDLAGSILPQDYDGRSGWVQARDGEQWYVINMPALAKESDILGRLPGEALWPDFYTKKMVEQERVTQGERNFAALYQQMPVAEGGNEFKSEWIQYYDFLRGFNTSECNVYILVDPANEKKETSDYTAMIVVALSTDNNYYILDIVYDKLNPTERINKLIFLHKKWNQQAGKPPSVAYEKYGMMSDTHFLKKAQATLNYRFPITEVGGSMRKVDRIRRLIPLFQSKRFYLPHNIMYLNASGKTVDLVNELIKNEMEHFPSATHDDMLDALSRICDENVYATFPRLKEPVTFNIIGGAIYEPNDKTEDWMNW